MNTFANATVAFRADASLQIGTGHVMRCLTLADELRRRGAHCVFVCREHPGHLGTRVERAGFQLRLLPAMTLDGASGASDHASWLGCSWQVDADQTRAALGSAKPNWLVVDHYALGSDWEIALFSSTPRLLAIDDLADRPHSCTLLLDPNLGHADSDYRGLVPSKARVLAGPAFALLRPAFAAFRTRSLARRRARPVLEHLLISMGGVDRPDATGAALQALKAVDLPQRCRISVVMGAAAPALARVRALAAAMPWPIEVLVDVDAMAQTVADSDLVIGAAGGSAWERCCLGVPSLLVVLAENQRSGAAALAARGAALLLGDLGVLTQSLPNALRKLAEPDRLATMIEAAAVLTDGLGAARVADEMAAQHE